MRYSSWRLQARRSLEGALSLEDERLRLLLPLQVQDEHRSRSATSLRSAAAARMELQVETKDSNRGCIGRLANSLERAA